LTCSSWRWARGAALALLASVLPWSAVEAQYQFGPNIQSPDFGKNKVQYRQFKWETYHSPHFTIFYYKDEEPSLQKVVSFAESAYDELSRQLNFQIKEPVPLIFYATHSAFEQNNVLLDFIDEATGAFAVPARSRMVLPIDLPDSRLITIVRHELTHVFQFKMLFGGSLARALTSNLPQWFIEGMASYFGRDETSRDKMFLRDAVVNDRIPSVRAGFLGFFGYRYGHAFFDFVEERWGHEGVLDFLFEVRNTITGRLDRAIKKTFKIEAEDFDIEFRRWARKKFLNQLVVTGEPSDFGKIFRVKERSDTENISPAASPSGDLVAAFSAYREKPDVILLDARKRTFIRNLTRGYSGRYQYLISQELSIGRTFGRDLAFSPDGNRIAVFAKREKGRSLLLLDVLNGGINRIIDMPEIEQALSPAWSPDGKKIAFSGWKGGNFDIFELDLESRQIVNLTNDEIFDGAPSYSPDGKSIVFVSVVGTVGYAKIFRMDLDHPGQRYQITTGDSNENDPVYSPDGKRLILTSDRATEKGKPGDRENIYSLDPATGELDRFTNVVTGAFMPSVIKEPAGGERIIFASFWKGAYDLFETTTGEPLAKETIEIAAAPVGKTEFPHFEPDIQVSIDPANKEKFHARKFFLEDAGTSFGVASDQTFLGVAFLSFSDYLGDRRIVFDLATVNGYSAFDLLYANLSHRLQWQVRVFDDRTFFLAQDFVGHILQEKIAYQQTGAVASLIFPFNFYDRFEIGLGAERRKIGFPEEIQLPDGTFVPTVVEGADNFPIVEGALVGDTTIFSDFGPLAGRRWRIDSLYAPQLNNGGGTLYTSQTIDARQYVPLTLRSNLAFRGFIGIADGNRPSPYYFGGLDTLRAFDLFSLVGDRAFFANAELRFPLIDYLVTPILGFRGIRGNIFLDTGGAWFHKFQSFRYYNSQTHSLQNGVADYGFGLSVDVFGLPINWDFAKQWTIKTSGSFRTEFWVGTRF
jgi:outer membrane protein assembly factor BamB